MKLAKIRDFLAVIECGSISAAARKLGVSQPGLTKRLGASEARLGAALRKRTPTGVTLTRQRHAFPMCARAGHAELAKAQEELARGTQAQVALGFGPFLVAHIVPQAVLRFREKFPDVELRLVEGLGHTTRPLLRDDPAIRFKPIAHLGQIVVARRGHSSAHARSAGALAGDEWLSVVRRDATAQALRALGVPT